MFRLFIWALYPVHNSGITSSSWHLKSHSTKLFVQQVVQPSNNNNKNNKAHHHLPFVWGILQWTMDCTHKEPVMWKTFPCHDVVMITDGVFLLQYLNYWHHQQDITIISFLAPFLTEETSYLCFYRFFHPPTGTSMCADHDDGQLSLNMFLLLFTMLCKTLNGCTLILLSHFYFILPVCYCDLSNINSMFPGVVIWWHRSGSTLARVMACCLTAPSHYLNQCCITLIEILNNTAPFLWKCSRFILILEVVKWQPFSKWLIS